MEGSAKVQSASPEEQAFRRYYAHLLSAIRNPIKFAELLLDEGVIAGEEKDCITSNTDDDQTRLLVDFVQYALSRSSDASETLRRASRAMRESGGSTWSFDRMHKFAEGESIYSTQLERRLRKL